MASFRLRFLLLLFLCPPSFVVCDPHIVYDLAEIPGLRNYLHEPSVFKPNNLSIGLIFEYETDDYFQDFVGALIAMDYANNRTDLIPNYRLVPSAVSIFQEDARDALAAVI